MIMTGEANRIDEIKPGMSQSEVRELLGEPWKIAPDHEIFDDSSAVWLYRNAHQQGYTYLSFDAESTVKRIQLSATFGVGVSEDSRRSRGIRGV
jgi:outer membrane protein assembly factor BamE (lipoprotein component of BamABCDE complex)